MRKPKHLTERDGNWHFVRRVPGRYVKWDTRGIIKHSTGVAVADDPAGVRASNVAKTLNSDLEASWRALAAGQDVDLASSGAEARDRARRMGFPYLPADQVAAVPLGDYLARFEALLERKALGDPVSEDAVTGAIDIAKPVFLLSGLVEKYEAMRATHLAKFSPDQLRRWRNAKTRAVDNLISVVGDLDIKTIRRSQELEYRTWWHGRINEDELDPDTANKDFGHLAKMIGDIDKLHELELRAMFYDMRFEGGFAGQRIPYDRKFVQEQILAPGRLMTLNDEARRVVFLIAGTGMRISECVNLTEQRIDLAANIPHVSIRPDNRVLKTDESLRDMPLVGIALEAVRLQPKGFPRYLDKGATLSMTVNKYLDDIKLRPNGESLYSLRHTFKDSLIDAEAPAVIIDHLMGHATDGAKYGKGPTLDLKLKWISKVAFPAPAKI
jgi:hypothetical protein